MTGERRPVVALAASVDVTQRARLNGFRLNLRGSDPSTLLSTLKTIGLLPGTFVWVAAEAMVTRAIRSYLVQGRGHPLSWMTGAWAMRMRMRSSSEVSG